MTELREYMLFCISRDLQASSKCRQEDASEWNDTSPDHVGDPRSPVHACAATNDGDEPDSPSGGKSLDDLIQRLKGTVFAPQLLHQKLGSGKVMNLSNRLTRYMQELEESMARLIRKYHGDVLLIDTVFESGNLLRADRITPSEYRLYMQVDTNTRGHQQWFYFRVRNTRKNRKYVFKIMNFTKPGITGGSGYRKNELF